MMVNSPKCGCQKCGGDLLCRSCIKKEERGGCAKLAAYFLVEFSLFFGLIFVLAKSVDYCHSLEKRIETLEASRKQ